MVRQSLNRQKPTHKAHPASSMTELPRRASRPEWISGKKARMEAENTWIVVWVALHIAALAVAYGTRVAAGSRLHARNGVFDDDGACRRDPQQFRRLQKCIRGRLAGEMLGMDDVAVDSGIEETVQSGGFQDSFVSGYEGGCDYVIFDQVPAS